MDSRRQPLPYMGDDMDRYDRRGTPFVRDKQGEDRSGTKHYRFNALGFRGAEFAPDAARHVFVFGESHAFGGGLNEEEAWPEILTRGWCDSMGVERTDVCLSNFAEGGSSNGYIARAVITQCEQVRPDLVAVELASMTRGEVVMAGRTARTGDWLTETTRASIESLPNEHFRKLGRELIRRSSAYERFATPLQFAVDTMLNMMLVRSYCAAAGIRAIASVDCLSDLREIAAEHRPAGELLTVLDDGQFLMPTSMRHLMKDDDRAADGGHPGVVTHRRHADALLEFLQQSGNGVGRPSRQSCATLLLGERHDGDADPHADDVDLRRAGISNAGIARGLVLALTTYRPERIEIQFADYRRSEGCDANGELFDVPAPDEPQAKVRWALSTKQRRAKARMRRVHAFREFATDGSHALESLRWMLLTQYLVRAHQVSAVGRCHQWHRLSEYASCESLAPLLALVDPTFMHASVD